LFPYYGFNAFGYLATVVLTQDYVSKLLFGCVEVRLRLEYSEFAEASGEIGGSSRFVHVLLLRHKKWPIQLTFSNLNPGYPEVRQRVYEKSTRLEGGDT
jgi:hypothetical protein